MKSAVLFLSVTLSLSFLTLCALTSQRTARAEEVGSACNQVGTQSPSAAAANSYYPADPGFGSPPGYSDPTRGPNVQSEYQAYSANRRRRPDKPDVGWVTTDIPPPGRPDRPDVSGSADSIGIGSPRLQPLY